MFFSKSGVINIAEVLTEQSSFTSKYTNNPCYQANANTVSNINVDEYHFCWYISVIGFCRWIDCGAYSLRLSPKPEEIEPVSSYILLNKPSIKEIKRLQNTSNSSIYPGSIRF